MVYRKACFYIDQDDQIHHHAAPKGQKYIQMYSQACLVQYNGSLVALCWWSLSMTSFFWMLVMMILYVAWNDEVRMLLEVVKLQLPWCICDIMSNREKSRCEQKKRSWKDLLLIGERRGGREKIHTTLELVTQDAGSKDRQQSFWHTVPCISKHKYV